MDPRCFPEAKEEEEEEENTDNKATPPHSRVASSLFLTDVTMMRCFVVLLLVWRVVSESALSTRVRAESYFRSAKGVKQKSKNFLAAADLFEKLLEDKPNDAELHLRAAEAVNCYMRTETKGNTLTIDGCESFVYFVRFCRPRYAATQENLVGAR